MSRTRHKDRDDTEVEREAGQDSAEEAGGEDAASSGAGGAPESERAQEAAEPTGEADILRSELSKAEEARMASERQAAEFKDKYLRARADLDNYRRRATQELDRAREAGVDSAVLTVLAVYDDLRRALEVAVDDPKKLIPGVEAVLGSLRRNLEGIGIQEFGAVGDVFDPDRYEALGTAPCEGDAEAGTVAQVYQAGFIKDQRLIRPARVIVYESKG